jgi:hypothetical protein
LNRPHVNWRGLLLFGLILVAALVLVTAFVWRGQASKKAVRESQRQDYALCIAQNNARKSERTTAQAVYALVSGVLRSGGPIDPQLKRTFMAQEERLSKQLSALRPLDCATYVRPDLPPDQGVR